MESSEQEVASTRTEPARTRLDQKLEEEQEQHQDHDQAEFEGQASRYDDITTTTTTSAEEGEGSTAPLPPPPSAEGGSSPPTLQPQLQSQQSQQQLGVPPPPSVEGGSSPPTLQPQLQSQQSQQQLGEGFDEYIQSPEVQSAIAERSPGGRYVRFSEKLGSGASKDVYRAYDTQEGIEVAWNVVNLSGVPKTERNRIVNEVRLLERLHHHNIISFHGSWVNRERQEVNFVTEILSSGTLKSFINKVQVIRWKIAKRWAVQILQGLQYLHSQDPPVIHRDLKCENIFINGTSGDLRIGDLGLSTVHRHGRVLSVLGTPEFMAPDMYEDQSYDEKVDIYAFGMCMLEIFTKEIPYKECMNPAQIYKKVSNAEPPEVLSRLQSRNAREFVELCLGYKHENGRYVRPSAAELLVHPFLDLRASDDDEVIVDPPLYERAIAEGCESQSSTMGTPTSKFSGPGSGAEPSITSVTTSAQDSTGVELFPGENSVQLVFPRKSQHMRSISSMIDSDGDQFEDMPQTETQIRKVKVMMGRGRELEEDDDPVDRGSSSQPGEKAEIAASASVLAPVVVEEQPPAVPSVLPPVGDQQQIGAAPPPPQISATTSEHYLVAAAVLENESPNTRPYPDDVLKLVVTLPVEGQTQNVQFDFHLVEDDPVKVAKEMVQELGIPQGAVLEISETISGLACAARMKVEKFINRVQPVQHASQPGIVQPQTILQTAAPPMQQTGPPLPLPVPVDQGVHIPGPSLSQQPMYVQHQQQNITFANPSDSLLPPLHPQIQSHPPLVQGVQQTPYTAHHPQVSQQVQPGQGHPPALSLPPSVISPIPMHSTPAVHASEHVAQSPGQLSQQQQPQQQQHTLSHGIMAQQSLGVHPPTNSEQVGSTQHIVQVAHQQPAQVMSLQPGSTQGMTQGGPSQITAVHGMNSQPSSGPGMLAHPSHIQVIASQPSVQAQPTSVHLQVLASQQQHDSNHASLHSMPGEAGPIQTHKLVAASQPRTNQASQVSMQAVQPAPVQTHGFVTQTDTGQGNQMGMQPPQQHLLPPQVQVQPKGFVTQQDANQGIPGQTAFMTAVGSQQGLVSQHSLVQGLPTNPAIAQTSTALPAPSFDRPPVQHQLSGSLQPWIQGDAPSGAVHSRNPSSQDSLNIVLPAMLSQRTITTGSTSASDDSESRRRLLSFGSPGHSPPPEEEMGETDPSVDEELKKLEEEFERNMQRAKKVFDNRMDNLQRSQIEREAQHQKTLEKHQKERAEFEKRLAQEEEQQLRRMEQLQREWEKKREALDQNKRRPPPHVPTAPLNGMHLSPDSMESSAPPSVSGSSPPQSGAHQRQTSEILSAQTLTPEQIHQLMNGGQEQR